MDRPITTLFMLMSVDGKISTGASDELEEHGLDKESETHALLPRSAGGLADAYNTLRSSM